jgi:DNA-binding transcriptional ArsR family regulator
MLTILNALAEPNRLQIVEFLQGGAHSVNEIVTQLKLPQPQVSKHLRVLHEAGLVEVQTDAQRRIYRLRPQPFRELDGWVNSFRQLWDERFDRLDEYLRELQAPENRDDPPKPNL